MPTVLQCLQRTRPSCQSLRRGPQREYLAAYQRAFRLLSFPPAFRLLSFPPAWLLGASQPPRHLVLRCQVGRVLPRRNAQQVQHLQEELCGGGQP